MIRYETIHERMMTHIGDDRASHTKYNLSCMDYAKYKDYIQFDKNTDSSATACNS